MNFETTQSPNILKKESSDNLEPKEKLKKEAFENFLSLSSTTIPKLQSNHNNNNIEILPTLNNNNSAPNPLDAIQKMYAETER